MSEYYKTIEIDGGGTKAIVSIPAWAQALHEGDGGAKDTIGSAAAAYAFVPLVYRAVRLRCDSLASVPLYFTKLDGETEIDPPFEGVDWKDLLWKTEAALALHGANYVEKIARVRSKKTGALAWINPVTMSARMVKGDDGIPAHVFQQGTNGSKWTLDDMVYMREFSLLGDMMANGEVRPGDSPAKVALNDAALLRYMSRFAARFFEKGAMPVTVLSIDGIVDKDEARRIEGWFKRAAMGIRNAFSVLALGRQIEPKVISQPLKDLAMPELNAQARHAVSLAFGIPQTMLEDAANFATSKEHRLSFWQDTMQPRGEWIAEQYNRQVLSKLGIQMHFGFEELDIYQEDEAQRAASLASLVSAIDVNPAIASWAMGVLGYDLTEDQEKELEEIITKKEERAKEVQENMQQNPPTTAPAVPAAETVTEPPAKAAWADDVTRWERKALRVLKESGSAVCEYVSDVLPGALRSKIEAGLPECRTAESVKALFDVLDEAVKTQTPAPVYRSDPEATALAESINNLAAIYAKSLASTPAPQPITNITLPAITMTANMPEQKEASITFSPVIEPPVNNIEVKAADAPQVVVNVPEALPPVVTVNVPEQAAPQITNDITVQPAEVKMPKPKRERQTVKRSRETGLIESTDTKIEYEE
jgi:HK97 family phage portal protein